MTYQEFKDKYNGKYIDYDKQFGNQCWDLGQQYLTECLGVPAYVLSGCGMVSNMLYPPKRNDLDTYFDEVPINNMIPGDVCIWDYGNGIGHIAIFDNWDGEKCWYFSQNYPKGSNCHLQVIYDGNWHAFRLKKAEPPKAEITPNVERDEYKNQIEVKVEELRVRTTPSLNGEILGYANVGLYNYYEMTSADDYTWFKIADNQWIAFNEEWETVYPAKPKEEFIQLKVLDKKDGYVLVDLGKVWIKE